MPVLQAYLLAVFVACVSAHWQWQWIQQQQQQWEQPPEQPLLQLLQWHSQWPRPLQQQWLRLPQRQQPLQKKILYDPDTELSSIKCSCQQLQQTQQQPQEPPQQPQQPHQEPQQPQQQPRQPELQTQQSKQHSQQSKQHSQQPQQPQEPPQQPQQPQEPPQQTHHESQQPQEPPQQLQQPPQQPQQPPQQPQEPPQQPQKPPQPPQQPPQQQEPPQEGKPYIPEIDQNCLGCICQASTSCNLTLECHNKGTHGYFCGPYWISWAYWYDAGRHGYTGKPEDFETCLIDKECAEKTVRGYMLRYGRDCDGSGTVDCSDFARIHKMGYKQCGSNTLLDTAYWKKIQLCIEDYQNNDTLDIDGRNEE